MLSNLARSRCLVTTHLPCLRMLHAASNGDMTRNKDSIHLQGMTFFGYHGVYPPETQLGQRFVVDLTMWCDLASAGKSDDLKDTVNYADVFRYGEPFQHIHHACAHLACTRHITHGTHACAHPHPIHLPYPTPRETQAVVEGPPRKLIESVAQSIAARVLTSQHRVTAVRVVVSKPHVAIPGVLGNVQVNITRTRE